MISEKILSETVKVMNKRYTHIKPYKAKTAPHKKHDGPYMLYVHIPFCESLCPYCSFNRYVFEEKKARDYFDSLKNELTMIRDAGYDFESMYIGGGTPTILPDELSEVIRMAKEYFSIKEVSAETNPNHLSKEHLGDLIGMIDRMSVGVQSFDNNILKSVCRYYKYGSAGEIMERLKECSKNKWFKTLNVDMIFNFPLQTEKMLRRDLKCIRECGCNQVTFYPLMASPSVETDIVRSVGKVSYKNEKKYYDIICQELTGGSRAEFSHGSAWAFNRTKNSMIDEYVVDYDEYIAAGSGGMSLVDNKYIINTFDLGRYKRRIEKGYVSMAGYVGFTKRDLMRYKFMMQLFSLRLDKEEWMKTFGCSVAAGLPAEYMFFKMAGAYKTDNAHEITISPKGRYLMVAMMRQFFIGVNTVRDMARNSRQSSQKKK